ncbi:MAG TPA: methyltransferase domain-containing protein [Chromatiaceae bacterium]|nr:methyltransferase domain-containing protein [Chromatiaceae bacterium]
MHLTRHAHQIISRYLHHGQLAIDATAGNGHDSCFLAHRVGPGGRVYAFDIQQQALQNTAERLQEQGLAAQVQLVHAGHQQMRETLPSDCHGKIRAVTFNLGYLPHGEKSITTTSDTTLPALQQASELLCPDGIISVLAYRGHSGGMEESIATEQKLNELASGTLRLSIIESPGPVLFILAPRQHD